MLHNSCNNVCIAGLHVTNTLCDLCLHVLLLQAWCLLALGISRALNIFPLALLVGGLRPGRGYFYKA
jgi:hypothetical protein